MRHPKSFDDLQSEWYEKLMLEGFNDIESFHHHSRPLKEWHNSKFASKKAQVMRASRSQYQEQIDDFMNHPSFFDACESLVSHGNCKFTASQVHLIWEYHSDGMTRRQIAHKLNRVKARIDDVIKRLTEWMKLT